MWKRSSRCDTSACVEVAWDKPSHCQHGDCVKVGHSKGQVLMRDSKDPDGPVLRLTKDQWQQFISYLKN